MVNILGLPLEENSSFLRGAAGAPRRIVQALHSDSSNLSTESGLDLGSSPAWRDAGDLALTTGAAALQQIETAVGTILESDERVLCLGGDHSVTAPIVRAHARHFGKMTVLHLDAHPDLYDDLDGNPRSHASPFARLCEAGVIERLVQVGIRTANPHQRAQAERFGVETIEMRDLERVKDLRFTALIYVSLDLDVLDPAFAPGVSHHEPGGMTTRELLNILQSLQTPLIGADIVEYNPVRDPNGVTAMVAAKLCKELLEALMR